MGILAIIKDDSGDRSLPPTLLQQSPQMHATPSTTTAHAHLSVRTAYMTNCVIADHVFAEAQLPTSNKKVPTLQQCYAFVAHFITNNQLHASVNASEHFIGAVIKDPTRDMLEY
jgi:hypothetical protein